MITKEQYAHLAATFASQFKSAGIALTEAELAHIEVADFGLGRIGEFGLELVVYVNTQRCCAKEMFLTPGQICPEHRHPAIQSVPGKEETFRCRKGEVYLYVSGEPTRNPKGHVPSDKQGCFTVWHEIVLHPGQQYTLTPDTLHWFQGGPEGAIVSEFSTTSRDEYDIFTDPQIVRAPKIG
ncbi:MAG: D-lyxose/D-mannose family sugar isomerase [Sphaerochaetaceae bacterium]